tara:strand:- start:76 stop:504 length:429 start_codon:yes stop_codon:yes gene_type:complete
MGLGNLFSKYETEPGGGWGPVADGDKYGRNLKRQDARNFLGGYGKKLAETLEANERNRSSNTETAQSRSSSSKDDDKVRSQIATLGNDIAIQEGHKEGNWTMPGTPGRKGILGDVVKTGLKVAFPIAGTIGSAAIGDRLDYI